MSREQLDKHFGRYGPCMFHPTRYSRHRLIDMIRLMYKAGHSFAYIRKEYPHLSLAAIKAAAHSSPDDNRMTRKEIREGKEAWEKAFPSTRPSEEQG